MNPYTKWFQLHSYVKFYSNHSRVRNVKLINWLEHLYKLHRPKELRLLTRKKYNWHDSDAFQNVTFYHQSVSMTKRVCFYNLCSVETCEKLPFVENSSFSIRSTYYRFNRNKMGAKLHHSDSLYRLNYFIVLRFWFSNWLEDVSTLNFGCFYKFFRFSWK